jgi:hypothetical protein
MRRALLCLSLAFLVACVGCKKKADNTAPGQGPPPGGPQGPPGGPMAPPTIMDPKEVAEKLPGGKEFAAAKKVYADNTCNRCHKLGDVNAMMSGGFPGFPGGGGPPGFPGGGGPPGGGSAGGPPGGGGPPGMTGPDLTKVGADATHTVDWLSAHIRSAKTHKPESMMPDYPKERISDADLKTLAEYLASRK